jgi:transcriptional regulator with XRE-family HTH domain
MEWDFSERLGEALKYRGWTQTELARRSGVHQVQVHKILNGKNPRVQGGTIRKLALALGISTDYLLGTSDEMNPKHLPFLDEGTMEEKDFLAAVAL